MEAKAAGLAADPEIVWKDLSTTATLTYTGQPAQIRSTTHGPKVIPPEGGFDTARYGDKPFPIVPVEYVDLERQSNATWDNDSEKLDRVVNDPAFEGSTLNLYQEMSYGQLFPHGTVPSAGHRLGDLLRLRAGLQLHDPEPDGPVRRRRVPRRDARRRRPASSARRRTTPASGRLVPAARDDRVLRRRLAGLHVDDARHRRRLRPARQGRLRRRADRRSGDQLRRLRLRQGRRRRLLHARLRRLRRKRRLAGRAGVLPVLRRPTLVRQHLAPLVLARAAVHRRGHRPPRLHQRRPAHEPRRGPAVLDGRATTCSTTDCAANGGTGRDDLPVFVRVGPYNVNPETVFQAASVISHEYGHHLGLPDFYNNDGVVYADMNLMASDYSQHMTVFGKQELGWVVPDFLQPGDSVNVDNWKEIKADTGEIHWQRPDGTPYTLSAANGDQNIHNGQAYGLKLGGRILLDPGQVPPGESVWWSGRGNDFGCSPTGGHNLDLFLPELATVPAGTPVTVEFQSSWDIEWDWDYGFVLTGTNDRDFISQPSRERLHHRQGLQPEQDRLPDRARQRPHRHERRLAAGRAVRRRSPARRTPPTTPTAPRSSTTATTSASWPARTTPASGSATSPTAPSTGRAGSSTRSSSRPVARSSTRPRTTPTTSRGGSSRTAGAPSPPRRSARPTTATTSSCATSRASTSTVTARRIAATRAGSRASSSSTRTRPTATATAATWSRRPSTTSTRSRSRARTASTYENGNCADSSFTDGAGDRHFDDFVDRGPARRLRQRLRRRRQQLRRQLLALRLRLPDARRHVDVRRERRTGDPGLRQPQRRCGHLRRRRVRAGLVRHAATPTRPRPRSPRLARPRRGRRGRDLRRLRLDRRPDHRRRARVRVGLR